MKKGFTLLELIVCIAIVLIVATIFVVVGVIARSIFTIANKIDSSKIISVEQVPDRSKSEWVVIGEGEYDHSEYITEYTGPGKRSSKQMTVVFFINTGGVIMEGHHLISHPKGSRIRISRLKIGVGTPSEQMTNEYTIELLDLEAK